MINYNIYFPTSNLNPQGWLTDFITPYTKRTNKRSDEANIFYDKKFLETSYKLLKNKFKNDAEFKDFLLRRSLIDDDKLYSLNGNFLDYVDTNSSLKYSDLQPEENEKYLRFMSRIKPSQQAFLQSYMKLQYGFKKNVNDENYTFIDFPFTQKFDIDFILNSGVNYTRAEGCGIKNISINNEFNFVTRVNSKITINYFIANMKILTREINEKGIPVTKEENQKNLVYGFSFLKLLENFDPAKQVIRLEYGRKVADGFINYVDNVDMSLKSIIERRERKVLYLNKIDHQFNFNQNGTITLGVTYLDLGTTAFLSTNQVMIPQSNKLTFESDRFRELLDNYSELKLKIKYTEEQLTKQQKQIDELNKERSQLEEYLQKSITEDPTISMKQELISLNRAAEEILKEIRDSYATVFLDKIKEQGQLFAINFKTKRDKLKFIINTNISLVKPTDGKFLSLFEINSNYDLQKYKDGLKNFEEYKNFYQQPDSLLEKIFLQICNTPGTPIKSENNKAFGNFMFFPLKALISVAYSFLEKDEKLKVPRIILGNCYLTINNKIVSINIGDLLVERDVFQQWYYQKCLSADRINYSFGAFITDIMSDLVPKILLSNKTDINQTSESAILNTTFYMDKEFDQEKKELLYFLDDRYILEEFCKKLSLSPSDKYTIPAMYFSQKNSISSNAQAPSVSNNLSDYVYNELQDIKKGIPHIKFGADGGVVKEISFNAMDDSRIRSAYAYEGLANNALRVRLYYYGMSLTMFGNNLFPYNSFVCVPFSSLGLESAESDPGLSGYYMVRTTTDTISEDLTYQTTADCVWQFSPPDDKTKIAINLTMEDNNKIIDHLSVNVNSVGAYVSQKIWASALRKTQTPATPAPTDKQKDTSKKDKK